MYCIQFTNAIKSDLVTYTVSSLRRRRFLVGMVLVPRVHVDLDATTGRTESEEGSGQFRGTLSLNLWCRNIAIARATADVEKCEKE